MAFSERRNKNTYIIRCECGTDSKGKRITKSMVWHPPEGLTQKQLEKELEHQKNLFQEICDSNSNFDFNMTFGQYVEIWKSHAVNNLRPSTFNGYCCILERVVPALGKKKLCKIVPSDLYSYYEDLREDYCLNVTYEPQPEAVKELSHTETRPELAEHVGISIATVDCIRAGKSISKETAERFSSYFGRKTDELFVPKSKYISDQTILHHHRLISTIMQSAVYDGIIDSNPCNRTKAPKVTRKEAKYLNDDEAMQLIETLQEKADHPFDTAIFVLLLTGMRRGECCALSWDDVDFEKCTLWIRKSMTYISHKGVFETDPKTYSSNRVINIGSDLVEILKEHKKWQEQQAEAMGDKWVNTGKIFTATDGRILNPDTLSSWFYNFITKNKLPYISLHGLRHTCASIMIMRGVPITTTAKRLGHSTSATTSKIYAHAIASADAATAEMLQTALPLKIGNKTAGKNTVQAI